MEEKTHMIAHPWRQWTPDEDDMVRREFARGAPDGYIAEKLGRSVGSVTEHRRDMGLFHYRGGAPRPRIDPTPAEIQAACAKFQESWDEAERYKRAGLKSVEWMTPSVGSVKES